MRVRATFCAIAACVALLASATVALAVGAAESSPSPEPAPLVCIDPGHGGPFSNANANGLKERAVNLKIALALREVLLARGYRVVMTRTKDTALMTGDTQTWNPRGGGLWSYSKDHKRYWSQRIPKDDLTARTRVANKAGADLFISIHCNGAYRRSTRGIETWSSSRDILGTRLARLVQSALVSRTGLVNRGAKTHDYYVLRWTNMPAILVEGAFITNRSDAAFLKTSSGRGKIATGIADGVDAWFATGPHAPSMPSISASSQADAAVAVSVADFPAGASTVVLGSAAHAADVPGLAPLAVRLGAALLLADEPMPSDATLAEILRLNPSRVILAGPEGALDTTGTAGALQAAGIPASAIESITAGDRMTLSVRIAEAMGSPGGGRVILVNERDSGSKRVAAGIAARSGNAILLTTEATLGPAADYLAANATSIRKVLRLWGQCRPARYRGPASQRTLSFSDSARMLRALNIETYPSTAAGSLQPVVASVTRPGDVLTASAHAGRLGQPVILTRGAAVSPYMRLYLSNKRTQTGAFWILGSDGSMPFVLHAMLAKCDRY